MEAWFLSDLHLKSSEERNGQKLLRFLHFLEQRLSTNQVEGFLTLVLLGDIFDLWVASHKVFIKRYEPILLAISNLKKNGARIIFIEGNHDVHIDKYWEKQLGAEVYVEAQIFNLCGHQVRCEHGDLINLSDQAYLRYRTIYRHPVMRFLAHLLPGIFWLKLGEWASRKSSRHSRQTSVQKENQLREMIRDHGQKVAQNQKFDYIISGHMHIRDDFSFTVQDRKVRSINLGSWFDQAKVFRLGPNHSEWLDLD